MKQKENEAMKEVAKVEETSPVAIYQLNNEAVQEEAKDKATNGYKKSVSEVEDDSANEKTELEREISY